MYPYYSSKKYPSWCTCCLESKYLKNKFAAYYHIKKTMSSSKKSKAKSKSPSASSNEHTPQQTVGKKRPAESFVSPELELFYTNCNKGGLIFLSQAKEDETFQNTINMALENLSKEDKMSLLHDFMAKFTQWKEEKSAMKEHYDHVYENLLDMDWKNYLEDFKKRSLRDGIPGDHIKSTQVIKDEIVKLTDIVQVLNDELNIREKIEEECIWRAVISKIEKKDLRETRVYEITNTPQSSSSSLGPRHRLAREVSREAPQQQEEEN
jgi:hypothetical protein